MAASMWVICTCGLAAETAADSSLTRALVFLGTAAEAAEFCESAISTALRQISRALRASPEMVATFRAANSTASFYKTKIDYSN